MKTNNKRQVTAKKTSSKSSHGRKACQCGICCLESAPKLVTASHVPSNLTLLGTRGQRPCPRTLGHPHNPVNDISLSGAGARGVGVSPRVRRRDCKFPIAASTTTLSSSPSSFTSVIRHKQNMSRRQNVNVDGICSSVLHV